MTQRSGFTLIELSIVLVIIGLIIGGVLVGQDLIAVATVRSQLTQIEKYQTAVNTFRGKYNNKFPGDMDSNTASIFGFAARGTASYGQGDDNGIIQGYAGCCTPYAAWNGGEPMAFWVDLSTAGLIDGKFTIGTPTYGTCWLTTSTSPAVKDFLPQAKLGNGNFVYVFNNPQSLGPSPYGTDINGNYFGISVVTALWSGCDGWAGKPGMTVAQANYIDTKIDDANPLVGRVLAYDATENPSWVSGGVWDSNLSSSNAPDAFAPSSTTCFDNGNQNRTQMHYSMQQSNGQGVNCAISIKLQ